MKTLVTTGILALLSLNSMAVDNTRTASGKPMTGLEDYYLEAPAQVKLEREALAGDAQSAIRLSRFYRYIKEDIDLELLWLERAYAINRNSTTKCELGVTLLNRAKRDHARAKALLMEARNEGVKSADSWLKEIYRNPP